MESKLGQIFTFYSYKGGTGRSMALANVACLLADKCAVGEKVLMIDWDLEAPGLHRFFDQHLKVLSSFELDKQFGLIDLFVQFKEFCKKLSPSDEIQDYFFEKINIGKFILKTDLSNLFLMTAGRFDDLYPTRVNTFNWEELFLQSPSLIPGFANYLAKNFKYVLIDSRTGFSDISSVCTSLMPEKLIVVFTPNKQSLTGVLGLVEHVTNYRKNSDDLRPLVIFPLPSRIENAELGLQKDWRFGNKKKKVAGYQPQFEEIFKQVYDLPSIDLTDYFNDVQIQYVPRYSYGEEISVLLEQSENRLSLSRSYESFTNSLVKIEAPWEYQNTSIRIGRDIPEGNIVVGDSNIVNVYIQSDKNNSSLNRENSIDIKKQLQIFLCHSSHDKPSVRELYKRLSNDGFSVWLDEVSLLPGQDWGMEIQKAVRETDVVLVCLSSQSITKEGYVQRELRYVLDITMEKTEGTVFLIPVRLDDCEVPRRIRSWHYLDFFPDDSKDLAYERLKKSLRIREASLGIRHSKKQ
jgi:cellulose biosynthesis protein BcsQ